MCDVHQYLAALVNEIFSYWKSNGHLALFIETLNNLVRGNDLNN